MQRVEQALDRLEQLQAAQRLERPLSESELDGIASRVFQKIRVNVLRVFALTRAVDSPPVAAPVELRVDPAAVERVLARRRRKGVM
jgi:hypothetical protein